METRSSKKKVRNISKSTRSHVKADKARQDKLKALYHNSLAHNIPPASANKNKHRPVDEREPSPPRRHTHKSSSIGDNTSMSPIRIMVESRTSTDELNGNIDIKSQQDTIAPKVEATADEVTETPEQREARRKAHPLTDITEPLPTDCLFGRGGGTNHHPGNKLYRQRVEDKKELYLKSKRLDKPIVAMDIIKEWRDMDPPGRFLKQDDVTKLWNDVGDKKAREKTSQALREKPVKDKEDDEHHEKETRFENGTNTLRRGNLITRDHSLGTEIVGTNDYFSMEGFSWDEHDSQAPSYPHPPHVRDSHPSYGGHPPPPPPHHDHHHYPSPHHYGHPPPPPSPHHHSPHHYPPQHDYYHRPPSGSHHDRDRNNSLSMNSLSGASAGNPAINSFDDERARSSWGHTPRYSYDSGSAPPPLPPPHYGYSPYGPPPPGYHPHAHYGRPPPQSAFAPYHDHIQAYDHQMPLAGSPQDFTKIADLMGQEDDEQASKNREEKLSRNSSNSSRSIDRSSSWGGYERKHSLVLRDTSIGSFGPFDAPDNTEGNEFFDDSAIQRSKSFPYQRNDSNNIFPSPPQPVQTRKKPECVEKEASPVEGVEVEKPNLMRKISGGKMRTAPNPPMNGVLRPEPVKRDTSNQPESNETKRSIKRVVLSRDKSAVSRSLKEQQSQRGDAPQHFRAELIDRNMSVEMNKLGLGDRPSSLNRVTTDQMLTSLLDDSNSLLDPEPLTLDDRLPTIDAVAMGIAKGERASTCDLDDALGLIMENDEQQVVEAPSAVNEDIAAKWLKGESFAEDD